MNVRAENTAREVRLRRVFGERKRTRKKLPRQHPPLGIERDYGRALAALMREIRAAYQPLLEALPGLTATAITERERVDAGETKEVLRLMALARSAFNRAFDFGRLGRIAEQFGKKTTDYQKVQLKRQTTAALGVDILMPDKRLASLIEAFVDSNVGLIKNLGEKTAQGIEAKVMQAITTGTRHETLAKDLEETFLFSEKRAMLIARDQVGKAYGQANAQRQRELGVTRFIWHSVNDSRVRDEHRERNGKTYSYADPPDGELPGEPVLCRCYGEPILDDILEGL